MLGVGIEHELGRRVVVTLVRIAIAVGRDREREREEGEIEIGIMIKYFRLLSVPVRNLLPFTFDFDAALSLSTRFETIREDEY